VQLITEITRDNLNFCKKLMIDNGVRLRHLDGLTLTFSVWDAKHLAEGIQVSNDSTILRQVLYSNLEQVVVKSQFLFDSLWKQAVAGESKIKDLENHSEGNDHEQSW
jgi:hypothetical protein